MIKQLRVKAAQKFTEAQLQKLRDNYSKIETIDPAIEGGGYDKMRAMLDNMAPELLQQIVKAKIKFMSSLAANALGRKGLKIEASVESNGRFQVILEQPYYDQSTDAYKGTTKKTLAAFESREEAEKFLQEQVKKFGYESEEELLNADMYLRVKDTQPEATSIQEDSGDVIF